MSGKVFGVLMATCSALGFLFDLILIYQGSPVGILAVALLPLLAHLFMDSVDYIGENHG